MTSSRSLTEAVQGLMGARAQIAVPGTVVEVRADGSVYVLVHDQIHHVKVVTDQFLLAGMKVELVKGGTGGETVTYTLLGSR